MGQTQKSGIYHCFLTAIFNHYFVIPVLLFCNTHFLFIHVMSDCNNILHFELGQKQNSRIYQYFCTHISSAILEEGRGCLMRLCKLFSRESQYSFNQKCKFIFSEKCKNLKLTFSSNLLYEPLQFLSSSKPLVQSS